VNTCCNLRTISYMAGQFFPYSGSSYCWWTVVYSTVRCTVYIALYTTDRLQVSIVPEAHLETSCICLIVSQRLFECLLLRLSSFLHLFSYNYLFFYIFVKLVFFHCLI
jgi:hypothetical protein